MPIPPLTEVETGELGNSGDSDLPKLIESHKKTKNSQLKNPHGITGGRINRKRTHLMPWLAV
jgi:hypothetical protein